MSETKEVAGLVERLRYGVERLGGTGWDVSEANVTMREAAREIERLQSDLTRYIDIATKEATEAEGLRGERDVLQRTSALMANDWVKFCDAMGVTIDTQEAVASEIKATVSTLTRQLEEAREALEPFAQVGRVIHHDFGSALFPDEAIAFSGTCIWHENGTPKALTWADFRRAAAIRSLKQGEREAK